MLWNEQSHTVIKSIRNQRCVLQTVNMELVLITKTYFNYSLFFKMGLFQALNFVDNYTSNPNWDFQPVYRARQIKFLCFWATLNITDLNVRVKIFKLIPSKKKKKIYVWNVAFKKHCSSSQRNNTISHMLKANHLERQTHTVILNFCVCHSQSFELSRGLMSCDIKTVKNKLRLNIRQKKENIPIGLIYHLTIFYINEIFLCLQHGHSYFISPKRVP